MLLNSSHNADSCTHLNFEESKAIISSLRNEYSELVTVVNSLRFLFQNSISFGAEEIVQLLKYLPGKHEDLSSITRTHIKKKTWV